MIPDALDDRREAPRRVLRRPASMVLPGNQLVQARALDISRSGMAIVAPANPPVGMACGLRIALPARDGTPQEIEPRVKVIQSLWSAIDNGFKVGLRFQELSPELQRLIREFVES